jgi:hypothetical protein
VDLVDSQGSANFGKDGNGHGELISDLTELFILCLHRELIQPCPVVLWQAVALCHGDIAVLLYVVHDSGMCSQRCNVCVEDQADDGMMLIRCLLGPMHTCLFVCRHTRCWHSCCQKQRERCIWSRAWHAHTGIQGVGC